MKYVTCVNICWAMLLLLLSSGATFQAHAAAAETAADNAEQSTADSGTKSAETSKSATKPAASSKGTDGVFVPSEEISEDFAVSFPVDI